MNDPEYYCTDHDEYYDEFCPVCVAIDTEADRDD